MKTESDKPNLLGKLGEMWGMDCLSLNHGSGNRLEWRAIEGESPVHANDMAL